MEQQVSVLDLGRDVRNEQVFRWVAGFALGQGVGLGASFVRHSRGDLDLDLAAVQDVAVHFLQSVLDDGNTEVNC